MATIGIVSEFNPFHNGHAYLIEQLRTRFEEDCTVICVMSGDFVQRGEPAVLDKFIRARTAVACGADLVVELPVRWSLSSAEQFAAGAVHILAGLGGEYLGYGCENDDILAQRELAEILCRPETNDAVSAYMQLHSNTPYAKARREVLAGSAGAAAMLLDQPNNLLAVEYLKAIAKGNYQLEPVAVRRIGAAHDGAGVGRFRSAAELRRYFPENDRVLPFVPEPAAALYREVLAAEDVPDRGLLETAILSRLRMLPEEAFSRLTDGKDGAGARLYKAVQCGSSIEEIINSAKTKRFALSRIRRMAMCAALGIEAPASGETSFPQYARVLAANKRGASYLGSIRESAQLPVLVKPSAVRKLNHEAVREFELTARAHDLYVLGYQRACLRTPGMDWKTGIRIV